MLFRVRGKSSRRGLRFGGDATARDQGLTVTVVLMIGPWMRQIIEYVPGTQATNVVWDRALSRPSPFGACSSPELTNADGSRRSRDGVGWTSWALSRNSSLVGGQLCANS